MTNLPPEASDRLAFAINTARAAGELTLSYFQSDTLVTEGKADGTPVTEADRAAEQLIRDAIARAYPGDGIIGEEFDNVPSTTGKTWIIDPIDGTMSFARGIPLYGNLIACLEGDTPTIGVINMPALQECVAAETNRGCWWLRHNKPPARASVSDHAELKGAMLLSTSFEYYDNPAHKQAWVRMNDLGAHTRGYPDCYAFVLVATARADAAVEPAKMQPWDIACVPPIITEAGGDWSTAAGTKDLSSGSMVVTNARIHADLLNALNATS